MNNEKLDNTLNVGFNMDITEIEKSYEISNAYNKETRKWTVIAKIIQAIPADFQLSYIPLLNNYIIISAYKEELISLSKASFIQYMEMPKNIFKNVQSISNYTCIKNFSTNKQLTGKGTIVGIIDTNFDLDIINAYPLQNRILYIWEQTADKSDFSPSPYNFGNEYNQNNLDKYKSNEYSSCHGSCIARIAAGNDGIANNCYIILVKLNNTTNNLVSSTSNIMCAIDYILKKSIALNMPVAINLSYGNNCGSHDGDSLFEQYINDAAKTGKCTICVGMGNEGNKPIHFSGIFTNNNSTIKIPFTIAPYEKNLTLQIWKQYWDKIDIYLRTPSENIFNISEATDNPQIFSYFDTKIYVYVGNPTPYSTLHEISLEFLPQSDFIEFGIWTLEFHPKKTFNSGFNLWFPSSSTLSPNTGFLTPDFNYTLTIPATCKNVISVGAYDENKLTYATFSGRGDFYQKSAKPDLCAPGVNISIANKLLTGTSFSCPFVTGCAALLMEWGITMQNDPFMYGEKLKATLIDNCDAFFNEITPNNKTGFGRLCIKR